MIIVCSIFHVLISLPYIFFDKNNLFRSFAHCFLGILIFLLLSFKSSLYIWIPILCQIYFLQNVLPVRDLPFHSPVFKKKKRVVKYTHNTNFIILTIFKYTVLWYETYSHCCATITAIHLQNFFILPN